MGLLDVWTDPVSAAAFRTDHLGRRPLHRPASAATLDSVLGRRGWTVEDLLAGRRKNVTAWMNALDGRHLTAEVPPSIAGRLYDAGTTLYLLEVEGLDAVSAAVAADLRVPVGNVVSGVFANQPGAYTPVHFDPVDTITVQLRGSKRWWIAPPPTPSPTVAWAVQDRSADPELWRYAHDPLPDRRSPEAEEYLLTPGSVLYVPRGWWHETSSDEESVSLHVHHIHLPWVDAVLDAVRGRLLRDARWRAGALTMWDPDRADETAGTAETLLDDLASVTRSLVPADLLPGGGRTATTGRYVRRAVTGIAFLGTGADGDQEVTVSAIEPGAERRSTIAIGPDQEAALRRLLTEEKPFTATDLAADVPHLTVDRADQLLALLTDLGFLRTA